MAIKPSYKVGDRVLVGPNPGTITEADLPNDRYKITFDDKTLDLDLYYSRTFNDVDGIHAE